MSLPDGLRAAALQLGRLQGDGVDVGEPLRDFELWARDSFSECDNTSGGQWKHRSPNVHFAAVLSMD